jgi:hypothetical protein
MYQIKVRCFDALDHIIRYGTYRYQLKFKVKIHPLRYLHLFQSRELCALWHIAIGRVSLILVSVRYRTAIPGYHTYQTGCTVLWRIVFK